MKHVLNICSDLFKILMYIDNLFSTGEEYYLYFKNLSKIIPCNTHIFTISECLLRIKHHMHNVHTYIKSISLRCIICNFVFYFRLLFGILFNLVNKIKAIAIITCNM